MRMIQILLIGCCLLLSACSLPDYSHRSMGEIDQQSSGHLYNIRIERWGSVRFSGLLVVKKRQAGLYYAMLDASGVKLVEAEVDASGEHRLLHAKMGIKDTQLPEYLSNSLKRISLLEPAQFPCSSTFLLKFCREKSGDENGVLLKYLQAGPVTLWQVETGNKGDRGAITLYSEPWLGIRIYLEDFQNIEH
jgi:hypothetical protein